MTPIQPPLNAGLLAAGVLTCILVHVAARLYPVAWRRQQQDVTPTGYGGFLGPVFVAGALLAAAPLTFLAATVVVAVATAVYWLDDAKGLGVRLRLGMQFVVGAVIAGLLLWPPLQAHLPVLVGACVLGGVTNVVLTNVVNFYDGADLNLALLMGLTAVCMMVFGGGDPIFWSVSVLALAFVLPFAAVNRIPRSLYLGDSGAFAFASLLTIIAASYLERDGGMNPLVFAPMALPLLDTAFVFLLRIARKEDLLSRNWHHLYQRLQIERRGFLYLIPQPVNLVLLVVAALTLERLGLHIVWATAIAIATVTPVFYFGVRKWLLGAGSAV